MITPRQQHILRQLVEYYIESGQPVSSSLLVARSKVKLSSATVRNELAILEEEGYVCHPYTSSGCLPTEYAYRIYGEMIQQESPELSFVEKKIVERIVHRNDGELSRDWLRRVARALADISHEAVYVAFSSDDVYYTGLTHLFQKSECADQEITIHISEVLDHFSEAMSCIANEETVDGVAIRVGSKNPLGVDCSTLWICSDRGEPLLFGFLGPMRMPYRKHVARLNYLKKQLN